MRKRKELQEVLGIIGMKDNMEMKTDTGIKEATEPLVSIIVPVYNVRAYVEECVDSLCGQTYRNLEIILVDDGSSDGSGEICDGYARKDDRIRVIHQANQGLSAARNAGMDAADGAFFAFVDSDDAVRPDFVAVLYALLRKYRADIAVCTYTRGKMEEIRREVCHNNVRELCMTSEEMLRQWHGQYKLWETVAWNKLYRRSVWNGSSVSPAIRFPAGRRHEDVLTSHLIVDRAACIAMTMRPLYLYRIRQDSITNQVMTTEQIEENLYAQRERMAFFRGKRYWRAYCNLLKGYLLHVAWFGWKKIF